MARRLWILVAMLIALLVTTSTLVGKGKDKHKHNRNASSKKYGHQWERRGEYEYRAYSGRDERPPGWSRGNKTGWRDCGLPPGQAKKYGCYTYVNEGRRYYYYQDERGVIYERRPVIEIQGRVDLRK